MTFHHSTGKDEDKKDFVFEEFKSQIEKAGMKIDFVDETGLIHIPVGELSLKISLDNVRRNYERDNDIDHISDLVKVVASYSTGLPEWEEAKNDIYISLFPKNDDTDNKSFLFKEITDEFGKVYVHAGDSKLSWISENDLKKWNITEEELEGLANQNADRLLKDTIIEIETVDGHQLGLIETKHISLKGALLFAPGMKKKIEKDFGYPFYAVIPARDFCYIFAEGDFDFFIPRMGKVVVNEYTQSGYPITTEVLKFSDNGVEAIGKYSVD